MTLLQYVIAWHNEKKRGGHSHMHCTTRKTGIKKLWPSFCCLTSWLNQNLRDRNTIDYKIILDEWQKHSLTCWPLFDSGLSCAYGSDHPLKVIMPPSLNLNFQKKHWVPAALLRHWRSLSPWCLTSLSSRVPATLLPRWRRLGSCFAAGYPVGA